MIEEPSNPPSLDPVASAPAPGKESLYARVQQMGMAQKIQLALKGDREARALLVKDPNRLVGLAVLGNPRISEGEVETIAKSRNVSDEVLRKIAEHRDWMKHYAIVVALLNNGKVPAGVAIPHLHRLKIRDLAVLVRNRMVSEALRIAGRRLLLEKRS